MPALFFVVPSAHLFGYSKDRENPAGSPCLDLFLSSLDCKLSGGLSTNQKVYVILHVGNAGNAEVLNQYVCNVR